MCKMPARTCLPWLFSGVHDRKGGAWDAWAAGGGAELGGQDRKPVLRICPHRPHAPWPLGSIPLPVTHRVLSAPPSLRPALPVCPFPPSPRASRLF